MPMLTGYGNDQQDPMAPAADPNAAPEFVSQRGIVDEPGAPMPSAGGRTGADVIAAALAQPTVRSTSNGAESAPTTAPQGEMSYGADPGYGV